MGERSASPNIDPNSDITTPNQKSFEYYFSAPPDEQKLPEPNCFISFVIPAVNVPSRSKDPKTKKMKPDPAKPPRKVIEGYYTSGSTPNWTRLKRYHDWKDHVRECRPPALRSITSANAPHEAFFVAVRPFFFNKVHNDVENVRKGIVDALFPDGDKWVYGEHTQPYYDKLNPRVEVIVGWHEEEDPELGARP